MVMCTYISTQEPCEDSIELETSEGAVEISLRAVLPSVVVALPESLKFGLCAVQDSLSLDFQISNTRWALCLFGWVHNNVALPRRVVPQVIVSS